MEQEKADIQLTDEHLYYQLGRMVAAEKVL